MLKFFLRLSTVNYRCVDTIPIHFERVREYKLKFTWRLALSQYTGEQAYVVFLNMLAGYISVKC